MSVLLAREYFQGLADKTRVNCSCAVLHAFTEKYPVHEDRIDECKKLGTGRAPGGICGAVYAAQLILAEYAPQLQDEFDRLFSQKAGSLICREIRRDRVLSCVECVEAAASFLEKIAEGEPV